MDSFILNNALYKGNFAMLSGVKQSTRKVLQAMGFEAHRFHPGTSPLARLMVSMRSFDIDLVPRPIVTF